MNKFFISIVVLIGILLVFLLIPNNKELINNNEKNMDNIIVNLKTSLGDIKMELVPSEAPNTVDNFVKLAKEGFYNGTRFHRVIKDFMIQGGDPLSKDESQRQFWGTGGPGYKFDDEDSQIALVQGVIAMANSGPDTNGSQFFIITKESTPWLQGMHTGFGRVIDGLDVVMKIGEVDTSPSDQPLEDVILEEIIIE